MNSSKCAASLSCTSFHKQNFNVGKNDFYHDVKEFFLFFRLHINIPLEIIQGVVADCEIIDWQKMSRGLKRDFKWLKNLKIWKNLRITDKFFKKISAKKIQKITVKNLLEKQRRVFSKN